MAGRKGLYRVFYKNLCGQDANNRWNQDTVQQVSDALKGLFAKVIAHNSCPYSSVDCFAFSNGTTLDPGEVLIHFVANRRNSVVIPTAPRDEQQNINLNAAGVTFSNPFGVISEIWINKALPDGQYVKLIANSAFHELMHNKLDARSGMAVVKDIHFDGGGGLAVGRTDDKSSGSVSASTQISGINIVLMARGLALPIPQDTRSATGNEMDVNGMPVLFRGNNVPPADSA